MDAPLLACPARPSLSIKHFKLMAKRETFPFKEFCLISWQPPHPVKKLRPNPRQTLSDALRATSGSGQTLRPLKTSTLWVDIIRTSLIFCSFGSFGEGGKGRWAKCYRLKDYASNTYEGVSSKTQVDAPFLACSARPSLSMEHWNWWQKKETFPPKELF